MIFKVLKSYYGSELLDIEADSEEEALAKADNVHIDLDANLGEVKCEIQND